MLYVEPVAQTTASGFSWASAAFVACTPRRTSTPAFSISRVRLSMAVCHSARVGSCLSTLRWPPSSRSFSRSITRCPRLAATAASFIPLGPPPTTTTFFAASVLTRLSVPCPHWRSRPDTGFIIQITSRFSNKRATHSLAPTHLIISLSRPARALATRNGSAIWARVIPTMSAAPSSIICSAMLRSMMRPTMKTLARSPTISLARFAKGTMCPCLIPMGATAQ